VYQPAQCSRLAPVLVYHLHTYYLKNTDIDIAVFSNQKAVIARRYLHQGNVICQVTSPSSLCQRFPYTPFNAMVMKISKWSRIQDSCRITPKIESLVAYAMPDIPSKFQKDWSITFRVILLTHRQTNRQTNKNRQKHYLLGGGKYRIDIVSKLKSWYQIITNMHTHKQRCAFIYVQRNNFCWTKLSFFVNFWYIFHPPLRYNYLHCCSQIPHTDVQSLHMRYVYKHWPLTRSTTPMSRMRNTRVWFSLLTFIE